mgnify:CR=1 FL=1
MINMFEVNETNKMITQENLDVRTITLGISLLDCVDADLEVLNENIYRKITTVAKDLVAPVSRLKENMGSRSSTSESPSHRSLSLAVRHANVRKIM